jgi:hypothetical protein
LENKKKEKEVSNKISERRTGLSKQEIKAYELHKKGWSFMRIATKIKCSKNSAWKKVKKVKALYKTYKGVPKANDKPVRLNGVRLHNDSFSFLIHPISFWGEPNIVKLKHTSYLLVKLDGLHIQIFPEKLVVRFLVDIVASSVDECKRLARIRVVRFLRSFSYKGVRFLNDKFEQVSRHYALLDNDFAKKCIREKRKFIVLDKDDNKTRLVVDYSNSVPEFEAEHPVKGGDDANKTEKHFQDIIDKDSYLPSVLSSMIDSLMGDYIKTIKVFDNRMEWFAKNNESHQRVLEKTEKTQDGNLEINKETLKTLKEIRDSLKK